MARSCWGGTRVAHVIVTRCRVGAMIKPEHLANTAGSISNDSLSYGRRIVKKVAWHEALHVAALSVMGGLDRCPNSTILLQARIICTVPTRSTLPGAPATVRCSADFSACLVPEAGPGGLAGRAVAYAARPASPQSDKAVTGQTVCLQQPCTDHCLQESKRNLIHCLG